MGCVFCVMVLRFAWCFAFLCWAWVWYFVFFVCFGFHWAVGLWRDFTSTCDFSICGWLVFACLWLVCGLSVMTIFCTLMDMFGCGWGSLGWVLIWVFSWWWMNWIAVGFVFGLIADLWLCGVYPNVDFRACGLGCLRRWNLVWCCLIGFVVLVGLLGFWCLVLGEAVCLRCFMFLIMLALLGVLYLVICC